MRVFHLGKSLYMNFYQLGYLTNSIAKIFLENHVTAAEDDLATSNRSQESLDVLPIFLSLFQSSRTGDGIPTQMMDPSC